MGAGRRISDVYHRSVVIKSLLIYCAMLDAAGRPPAALSALSNEPDK
jgi:hypothetical protein